MQPDDAGAPSDARTPTPDAAPSDSGAMADGQPPNFWQLLPDTYCAVEVGAECDGNEDCADGEMCCGTFNSQQFRYTEIRCRTSCTELNDIELCHPGDSCARDGTICRASLIIPYDFVGVCALPQSALPAVRGEPVAGQIACGDRSCASGSEQCCLRARYDFRSMSVDALAPYCAPLADHCDCDHVGETSPPDAGPDAGRPVDEDGGAS